MLGRCLKVRLGMNCSTADMREGPAVTFAGEYEPDLGVIALFGEGEDLGLGAEGWVEGAEHVFVLGGYSWFDGGAAVGEHGWTPCIGGGFW